jgi:hypothetical protein
MGRLSGYISFTVTVRMNRSIAFLVLVASASTAFGFVFNAPSYARPPQSLASITIPQHTFKIYKGRYTLLHSDGSNQSADGDSKISLRERILMTFSTSAASKVAKKRGIDFNPSTERGLNALTLLRVGIPSVFSGIMAYLAFPGLALWLCTFFNGDAKVFAVLSQDSSQFVQNFLTVAGLLFSILVGQTYYFMYQQQETVYYALFNEVTEAKSLLEQVALVCQGRSMYPKVLRSIQQYVDNDLKQLQADPAVLLSARPMDDPLETIMYLTSVGVPSTVYETVRSLRQARAQRLGALQRKLPQVHMLLLWILAAVELVSFPLLGAGTQSIGGYNILTIEGCLFGVMTAGIVMALRVSTRRHDLIDAEYIVRSDP